MDDFNKRLAATDKGYSISSDVQQFSYVDDMCIVVPSVSGKKRHLDVCEVPMLENMISSMTLIKLPVCVLRARLITDRHSASSSMQRAAERQMLFTLGQLAGSSARSFACSFPGNLTIFIECLACVPRVHGRCVYMHGRERSRMNSHQESSESSSDDEAMIVLSYLYRASKKRKNRQRW